MLTLREVAVLVRELRGDQGLSQSELAHHARVSRSFVVDLESGKATVEAAKVLDVIQALGYEVQLRGIDSGEVRG